MKGNSGWRCPPTANLTIAPGRVNLEGCAVPGENIGEKPRLVSCFPVPFDDFQGESENQKRKSAESHLLFA